MKVWYKDKNVTWKEIREEEVKHGGKDVFLSFSNIGNILFVKDLK